MLKTISFKRCIKVTALLLFTASLSPAILNAQDPIEIAAVDIGVTAGNLVFLPAKAISVSMGLVSGALSYLLTGGNADLTKQIWQDTTQGPYLITPEVARNAIGQRPELLEQK
ncbi:MAG: hypothetical protein WD688_02175 [Candidatus Binatia bacterium]